MEPEGSLPHSQVLALSWASSIESIPPQPTSWRSILVLSSHLWLGLFPSGFPTKTLYVPLFSPIRATCPAHLILLNLITRTKLGEEYRSLSSLLHTFLYSLVASSVLGPTPYSQTPPACVPPSMWATKFIVLYILIFIILDSKLEDKRFCTAW